ncbi:aldo/keto reductase [Roseovarius amoyensis]|uniref:aldo/keto reductase n=1 Tax=Roseovarius amoyensis TaxID=2211448 RepID=UPI000DBE78DC|nr:aldo/keto reductase [Roseovarius amoyensis]
MLTGQRASPRTAKACAAGCPGGLEPRCRVGAAEGAHVADRAFAAVDACLSIARKHGLAPVQMALEWVMGQPFACLAIFMVASRARLATALGRADVTLTKEARQAIDDADRAHPMRY